MDIAHRGVWVLQHLCRRSSAATVPWLVKLMSAETLPLLGILADRFSSRKLLTRVCFLFADACHALANHSPTLAGMASAVTISPAQHRRAILGTLVRVMCLEPEPGDEPLPLPGCEVHEAAALALGDAFSGAGPELAHHAVESGVLRGMCDAIQRYPTALLLQVNGCWALRTLWESADNATRQRIATQGEELGYAATDALQRGDVFARLGSKRVDECREVTAAMRKGAGSQVSL